MSGVGLSWGGGAGDRDIAFDVDVRESGAIKPEVAPTVGGEGGDPGCCCCCCSSVDLAVAVVVDVDVDVIIAAVDVEEDEEGL